MDHDQKPKKHHRKCPAYKGKDTYCLCNEIRTPPTEPRYQKQKRLQWHKQWENKLNKTK